MCSANSGMVLQCELLLTNQQTFGLKKVDHDLNQLEGYQLLKINLALRNYAVIHQSNKLWMQENFYVRPQSQALLLAVLKSVY
jgi:hypothetical protein